MGHVSAASQSRDHRQDRRDPGRHQWRPLRVRLGAGHVWPGQARAFGLPEDAIFARFEDALQIIVPLLRKGHANFEGTFHAARDSRQRPRGPRPGGIPLLLGGNGPKGQRVAAIHADIYSRYVEELPPPLRRLRRGSRRWR